MASRVLSSGGSSAAATTTTGSSRSTSAILERTVRALLTAPPPIRLATRSTSIRATTLDTRSGQDRRSSRRAFVSGSGTTSFTMTEESRYRSFPATDYARSSRISRRASVPFVVTGPFWRGEVEEVSFGRSRPARSHQSPQGGSGLIDWPKHRHWFVSLRHLESLALSPPGEDTGRGSGAVLARPLGSVPCVPTLSHLWPNLFPTEPI